MLNVKLISIVFGVLFLLSCGKNHNKSDSDIPENNQVTEESQEDEAREEIEYIFGPCSVQRIDYKKFDINCSRGIEAIEYDSKITSKSLEKNGIVVSVDYKLVKIDSENSDLNEIRLKIMHRDATVTPVTVYEKNMSYGTDTPPVDTQENAFGSKSDFDSCRLSGNIDNFSLTCSEPIRFVRYSEQEIYSSLFYDGCSLRLEKDKYLENWAPSYHRHKWYDRIDEEFVRDRVRLDDRLYGNCRLIDEQNFDRFSDQDKINLEVVHKNGEVTKVSVSSMPTF